MYLKRIVLHGFKSFADRTEFEFGPGMTGIVGPNGCGKSNVLDALRWVLGEQSAKTLRGSKMLDVVFAGSRSRPPANFAEVELTFDNESGFLKSEQKEVIVGRLLYRSGESEYRLGGEVCRLKDVRDLFLDTGVGVDAYSIIEQGKVDALLAANPEQRREIFEEAAGISRYKLRRTETQRRLERTQQNLLRLHDVIEELERQLRSVKLAAGKARKFQECDQRLRELRSAVSLAEYHDLENARLGLSYQLDSLRDVQGARKADLAARDADAADLAERLGNADELLRSAERALAELRSEHLALTERQVQSRRRLGDLEQSRARLAEQGASLRQARTELETRVADETRAVDELVGGEREQAARIAELEEQRDDLAARVGTVRGEIEAHRRSVFESARRLAAIHNEQSNLSQQRQRLESQQRGLAERRATLDEQAAQLEGQRGALQQRVAEADAETTSFIAKLRDIEARQSAARDEISAIDGRISHEKESRSAAASRLGLLEDLERRLDGVGQGARWVLSWRGGENDGGVLGLVADLLRIDDPRVGLLQPALAAFEDVPVVRDSHTFLAELARRGEPPGAVRVLALDRLQTPVASGSYETSAGFVARAIDWVSCEPEHRPLADRLLGRVILVDVLERALALASAAPDGHVFVTLDGHAVEAGGAILVGSASAAAGLISRKSEIRQLRAEIDETESRLLQLARSRLELDASLSDLALQRESLTNQVAAAQRRHADARTEVLRLEDEAARNVRERQSIERDSAELARVLAEIVARHERMTAEESSAQQAQRGFESEIARLEQSLRGGEESLLALGTELTGKHVELGRIAERRTARESTLGDLRRRLTVTLRELEQAAQSAADAEARIAQTESELEQAAGRVAQLHEEIGLSELNVADRGDACEILRRRIEASGTTVRLLHSEIEEVETALRECEVSLRECEVRRDSLAQRVREELSVELAELYATYVPAQQDWDAQRAEIEELRGRIQRLGNVNLDAIAELEELSPRYDNLIAQRDDLTASVGQLQALIAELDIECNTRFAATFEQIRTNFQDLFRKLFGGGKADILLEDPAAPLECGIEIIARPPGKEPQSISLLSGGEKTMATVALLFSIFKSRPSPFAFLDEVDAALDEGNVGRFNTMLGEFLNESQFIVITHNKRTMQFADVLYGVTMEEPGVSRRVSVRFDERISTPNVA